MNIKFSIIIPIYNSEKYIEKCISSILKQTYKNFEILIINDQSNDSSLNKISSFNDERIKIINQLNSGVSAARNNGLKNAIGEYILFVDSDDYLTNDKLLEDVAKSNEYDLIKIGTYNEKDKHEQLNNHLNNFYERGIDYLNDELSKNKNHKWFLWQYVYKKELWNDITFPEGRIFEDLINLYKVILRANKIKIYKETSYFYSFNKLSETRKIKLSNCYDLIFALKSAINDIKNRNIDKKIKSKLLENITSDYTALFGAYRKLNKEDRKTIEKDIIDSSYILKYTKNNKLIKIFNKIFGTKLFLKLITIKG